MPIEVVVGIQLGLYGMGWALAALFIAEERRVLLHWCAYALLQALSALLAVHALERGEFPPVASLAASVLGFAAALRGVGLFAYGRATLDRWMGGLLAVILVLLFGSALWIPAGQRTPWQGLPYAFGLALLLIGASGALWRGLRADAGRLPAAVALLPSLCTGALALTSGVMRLTMGASELGEVRQVMREPNAVGSLVASAIFNFGFMFLFVSRLIRRLRRSARLDFLTGAFNRRETEEQLEAAWQQHLRTQGGLAVALIDLDHFKAINDRHGHARGDQALAFVARHLREQTRTYEHVGRWGGEEFLLLMPGAHAAAAVQTCERLRTSLSEAALQHTGEALTASIGVAVAQPGDASAAALVERADRAMYLAKAGGRNRVCAADVEAAPQR